MKLGGVLLLLTLVLVPGPTAGEMKSLSDEELDRITPAGQPQIGQSSGSAPAVITFTNHQQATLTLGEASQTSLKGLMLTNVVGNNQVANALNVAR